MQNNPVFNDITNIFKNCLDILRTEGLTGDKALRNLSYILILKLLENKFDDNFKNYNYDFGDMKINNVEKSKLISCIKLDILAKESDINILNALKNIWKYVLSQHPLTENLFSKNRFTEIKLSSTIKKLIITINKINLKNIDYDILGTGYEEVIKDLMTGKVLGQFFTQPIIKNIMIELINPKLNPDGKIESMCDPTMGTGGFLITYIKNILKQSVEKKIDLNWNNIKSSIYGKEIDPDTYQLAISNMLISTGHMFDELECGNSIIEPIIRKFDIVMANPPFGIKGINYDEINPSFKKQYFPFKSNSAVLLFLQAIIFMLKIDGRCAVVLPDGQDLFSRKKSIYTIREYLMKTCDLQEIIYLPADVFENTSIKTCIFYFVKKKEGTEVITVNNEKKTKFIDNHETKSVKFYEYDIKENKKNLLLDVSIELISMSSYSLNYTDYKVEEKKEYKKNIELKTLGDVCEINQGKLLNKKDMKSGIYKVVGGGKIIGFHDSYNRTGDDFTVTRVGDININYNNINYYLTDNGFSMKSKQENIISKFIYYYFLNNLEILKNLFRGTAQKVISKTNISSIQIPIPSLEIQNQIVEYLDFLDSCNKTSNIKIEELKKLNSYRVNNQMMFGINETKTLGDICKFLPKSKRHASYGKNDGKYPFFKSSMNLNSYVDEPDYKEESLVVGTGGNANIKYSNSFSCSTDNFIITSGTSYIKYLYYYFLYNINELEKGFKGTGIKHISKEYLTSIQIPIPSLEIQNQIVEYCDKNNDIINLLEKEIENNKKLGSDYIKSILS